MILDIIQALILDRHSSLVQADFIPLDLLIRRSLPWFT